MCLNISIHKMGTSLNLFSIKQTTEKNQLESELGSLLSSGVVTGDKGDQMRTKWPPSELPGMILETRQGGGNRR